MKQQQAFRLPLGGRINRNKILRFNFDGRSYQGYDGDTLASALLANGVRMTGRSFKFHRPRGILSAGSEESNALLSIGKSALSEPNVRAPLQRLYDGLEAKSQNCWPSLKYDIGAFFDCISALLPAGFYNKTFMLPSWTVWEKLIRRAAGLGRLPDKDDPDLYAHHNVHCDVLICGAGPAGIAAALAASEDGSKVILVDEHEELGGSLRWSPSKIDGTSGMNWMANALNNLASRKNISLLSRTSAAGVFDHNLVVLSERVSDQHGLGGLLREKLWKVRARNVIVATGSIEQPLPFPNNDRPGIMLCSAVLEYLTTYAVAAGKSIVIATNNDSVYETALELDDAGINVIAILDSRKVSHSPVAEKIRARNIAVMHSCFPLDTKGRKGITAVQVGRLDPESTLGFSPGKLLQCDCLAMSGGWQPRVHLLSQAGGRLVYDESQSFFRPEQTPPNFKVIGGANGTLNLAAALQEGIYAGYSISKTQLEKPARFPDCDDVGEVRGRTERLSLNYKPQSQWIDFQHDVTLRDIGIAAQESFVSVEHLKRYTTTGMSVDQGKTSNINALHALAHRMKLPVAQVGTTKFRPFYTPVTLGTIAGRRRGELYSLARRTPMHHWHESSGALIWNYGHWKRPAAYPRNGESLPEAVQREALAVRKSVGIYDGSPLGKIEIKGEDSAEFLNRLYINNLLTLKPGRARYGIMLNENGVIIDDGIVACLQENSFLVHTTSGNANHILEWMEEWHQCEWPELAVSITKVTTQWANVAVSGPNARKLVERIGSTINLTNSDFPHMSIREGECEGIPLRIMRASFTGELGYEVNVPADYGYALWLHLLACGEEFNVTPYGVESLMLLRTEKGYLHVGADTDGNTTPDDIGWGAVIEKKDSDFIGKRSLIRPENKRTDRLQLVGLSVPAKVKVAAGAHVLNKSNLSAPAKSQGFVTSAFYSSHLSRYVILALVRSGRSRMGERVSLFDRNETVTAVIVQPSYYDQKGERLHV